MLGRGQLSGLPARQPASTGGGDAVIGDSSTTAHGSRAAAREARAEQYFEKDLAGQRAWYGKNASGFKARAQALGVSVVVAGAATTFLQVFGGAPWVAVATALLGGLIVLAEGWR